MKLGCIILNQIRGCKEMEEMGFGVGGVQR